MCKNIKYANSTHKNYLINFIKYINNIIKAIYKYICFLMLLIVIKIKNIKNSDIIYNKNI